MKRGWPSIFFSYFGFLTFTSTTGGIRIGTHPSSIIRTLKIFFKSRAPIDHVHAMCMPCVFRRGYEGDRGQTVGPVLLGP